jgi:enoyl-[acyl-carrier protein] reductase I
VTELLKGKTLLVTGVLTDRSIAFSVARLAAEEGATVLLSAFGRTTSLTTRIAKRLPGEPPVLELDVTSEADLAALPQRLGEHTDVLDGVLHAIGFAPPSCLGEGVLDTPWGDVATALQVSTWSYPALARACLPMMPAGSSYVGLDFDASVAWPAYDWMGVAKAGLESANRYLARDLGAHGCGATSSRPVRSRRWPPRASRGSRSSRTSGPSAHRSAGTSRTPSRPPAPAWRCCRTGSRRRRAASSTSTAVSTPWAPDRRRLTVRGMPRARGRTVLR